ncbi:DNA methyltransferase [Exiguobacterium alkaliphilum]|uniref:DNA methyltransferase n=1 Tax=Exiguobacterium alkaliphilum TaxID=1428684 RepID=UPI001BA7A381|nr:site-specific DNA-methyltransferase [Exiguobacterium alkaliphilum]QUE87908.1 site-specific DNA-methyltransferase [Exiguobacterium alkaliphilum]
MGKIEPKIFDELKVALSSFKGKYFVGEELNRSKLTDDLRNYNEELIKKLFEIEFIKKHFIKEVAGQSLFQIEQLEEAILYNDYWDTSYTKYENRVGLASKRKFLQDSQDIVLDFPFKDGVLTASMTKEDREEGYDEAFLNEVIEKDEIDRLFDKKIFVNVKRFGTTFSNEESVSFDKETDNLMIKGNNLLALHTLKEIYTNKVKLIYIDPPYNTGKDSFVYNDKFNHSTWLTFIKNRLEIARELLSDEGVIFVHLDKNEVHYLAVLMDEIFGRKNYVETITVVNNPRGRDYGGIANVNEFILVYKKHQETELNLIEDSSKVFKFKDSLGGFDVLELRNRNSAFHKGNRPNLHYPVFINPNAPDENGFYPISTEKDENHFIELLPKKSNSGIELVWRWGKPLLRENANINAVAKKNNDGTYSLMQKYRKNQTMARSLWQGAAYNSFEKGTNHLKELFDGKKVFSFPKPESMLKTVLEIGSKEGDIVLDFFSGSGSTLATSIKMNRRFIGVEQMDYVEDVTIPRLEKVIAGEQGGISKELDWHGGGSFVYAELFPKNMGYLQDIIHSDSIEALKSVYDRMLQVSEADEPADIAFHADLSKIDWSEGFVENKRLLIKLLDKNGLYYNYSEIDDKNVRDLITDKDYSFNKTFYEAGEIHDKI